MLDLLTLVAIALLAWIAWQQRQSERSRLDAGLFVRRLDAYESIRRTLSRICADGKPTNDDLGKLDRRVREAQWLFDPTLSRALEEIAQQAAVLRRLRRSRAGAGKRKLRERLDADIESRVIRLRAELDRLPDRFADTFNRG